MICNNHDSHYLLTSPTLPLCLLSFVRLLEDTNSPLCKTLQQFPIQLRKRHLYHLTHHGPLLFTSPMPPVIPGNI